MAKKDAQKGPAIEQYRKSIGKHDKKDKTAAVKELKQRSEAKKSAMNIQDVLLLLGTFLALIVFVYFFFYMSLTANKDQTSTKEADR